MNRFDSLETWRIFCTVVEAGGVKAAAERLNMEGSNVTRTIRALEAAVGSELFVHGSRPPVLTEFGDKAYGYAARLMALHHEMHDELLGDADSLAGKVRVAAFAATNYFFMTKALVEFQEKYPEIDLSLRELLNPTTFTIDNGPSNDVIVSYVTDRMPENVIRLECGTMPFISCASPYYVSRFGCPTRPEESRFHTGLLLKAPSRDSASILSRGSETRLIHWKQTVHFSNLMNAQSALLLGAGICPDVSLLHCADQIEKKQLMVCWPGWQRPALQTCVLVSEQSYRRKRVKIFAHWLHERLSATLSDLRVRFPEFYTD